MEIIIAEKPRVAMKIANALGKAKKKLYKKKAPYYELDHSIIMPAVGHLFSLSSNAGSDYPVFDVQWKKVYEINKKYYYVKPYIENFEANKEKADNIIVATDYDNEGSLIGYNIARFIFTGKKVERMKFSTLTANELKKAYNERGDFDYGNAIAGETRHIVDWFYGINLSRALMSSLRKAGKYRVMSIGRVQGPTLALAVGRENEILSFKPEDYYLLFLYAKNAEFSFGKHIKSKEEAERIFNAIGNYGIINDVDIKKLEIRPLPAFDLTSLQVDAYRIFKISPSKTLQIAQLLYESSLISYPRTSSQQLPPSIGYRNILESIAKHNDSYSKLVSKILEKQKLWPSQGKKTDQAHPAIYPTGQKPDKLSEEERKIYELILRRFIAAFMDSAIKVETNVLLESNGILFKAEGVKIEEQGWLKAVKGLYDLKEKAIADFKKGEKVRIDDKKIVKERTKPPARYNEASLIKELEKRGLGTKATRAVIVSTLFLRKYLFKQKDGIHVSALGIAVYRTLADHVPNILNESLTREIEEDLEEIAKDPNKKAAVIEKAKAIITDACKAFKERELEIGTTFFDAIRSMRVFSK
ncbi:MAG: DNA topoisomerase I [Candidatus Anstonellales archaeon]